MQQADSVPLTATSIHVIHPTGVYVAEDLRRLLRLRASTVRREVREGRLRVSKRAGRRFFLGAWVLSWLESGEITKAPRLSDRAAV
jgi:hypothetical protein